MNVRLVTPAWTVVNGPAAVDARITLYVAPAVGDAGQLNEAECVVWHVAEIESKQNAIMVNSFRMLDPQFTMR